MADSRPQRDSRQLAWHAVRVLLGINFAIHGLVRVAGDYAGFAAGLSKGFEGTLLPTALTLPFAWLIPPLELGLGLALASGWQSRRVLLGLLALMGLLHAGVCLQQRWDVAADQLLYIALLGGLLYLHDGLTAAAD